MSINALGVYTKKEKESGKLRICNGSWTINLDAIGRDISTVKTIAYITPKCIYKISKDDAFKHGFIRNFCGENKLIVPLKYWEQLKGEQYEYRTHESKTVMSY